MSTLKLHSNRPLYNHKVTDTLAVDGWAVTFDTVRTGLSGAQSPPRCTKCNSINFQQCLLGDLCTDAIFPPFL